MVFKQRTMTNDKKEVLQTVIDNLNYVEDYKDKLIEFNKKFNAHEKVKFTNNPDKFFFGLDKAIS